MILSTEQIVEMIGDGNITAISLDTSIVDAQQRGLEYGLLKHLGQFNNSSIKVVFSDVVIHEIEEHLRKDAAEALSHLNKSLKLIGNSWQISVGDRSLASSMLLGGDTPESVVERRLSNFLALAGATVIDAKNLVDVGVLVNLYFSHMPPFSKSETKKHEFPDGLALLTLEKFADQNDTLVLVVTKDGDWKAYCEKSSRLVAVDDLAMALSCFQQEISIGKCKYLSNLLLSDASLGFLSKVEDAINEQRWKIEFVPEADSQFFYEVEDIDAELQLSEIIEIENQLIFEPVEKGSDYIVVRMMAYVSATVTCDFSFAKWDSEDKEYFSMGGAAASANTEIELELLITILETQRIPYVIDEIEVIGRREHVVFGEIEPDWMSDSG